MTHSVLMYIYTRQYFYTGSQLNHSSFISFQLIPTDVFQVSVHPQSLLHEQLSEEEMILKYK